MKQEFSETSTMPLKLRRNTTRNARFIDMLRTRGTPLEMIYSHLVASDEEGANKVFCSVLLELLYERLKSNTKAGDEVIFGNMETPLREGEEYIGESVFSSPCYTRPVADDGTACIVSILNEMVEDLQKLCNDFFSTHAPDRTKKRLTGIVPVLSSARVRLRDNRTIDGIAVIHAYFHTLD